MDITSIVLELVVVIAVILVSFVLLRRGLGAEMARIEQAVRTLPPMIQDESREIRAELRDVLAVHQQSLETRFASFGTAQAEQLSSMRREAVEARAAQEQALRERTDAFGDAQSKRLGETNAAVNLLAERLDNAQRDARSEQKENLENITKRIKEMTESNEKRQESIRETLQNSLESVRKDNETKLEAMRATVEEKLQGTLEQRLGESFKLVSERLEQVHSGLGEMKTLANGVGDLKRVLTNVKSRGVWGEVQLSIILEDMLTPDQYSENVRINPESGEVVEFAVNLPGKADGPPVLLAIDAKFPQESYDRLLTAQDAGDVDAVSQAASELDRAIRLEAKRISEKYICPPYSTDFAVMYLPTEGLFAEVVRRPGLSSDIQNKHRVMMTGPTTLAALLSSLQMGFRTLAIEKRTSEVWQVLSAAKTEFRKYGDVWDKIGRQLDTAKKTVEDAGRRTRAV